jgi:hypothetical protein
MLYYPYMNKTIQKLNKAQILYIFIIALTFITIGLLAIPNDTFAATSRCVTGGTTCGSDIDTSGENLSAKNRTTQDINRNSYPCANNGYGCGSDIDQSAGNASSTSNTSGTSNYSGSTGNNSGSNTSANSTIGAPVIYSITPDNKESGAKETTVAISGANFTKNSVARFNSSDRHTIFISSTALAMSLTEEDLAGKGEYLVNVRDRVNGKYSNSVIFTLGGTPAGANSIENTKGSDLAGNALFGANGFLPHTLLSWLLFAILILVLMIIWRKVYVTKEQREAPLKHA